MSRPVKRARTHRFSRPERQYSHSPQVQPSHGTPTRRPSSAIPTIWWPSTSGRWPGLELAVAQVQVGAADAARLDAQPSCPGAGHRLGDLGEPQRPARLVEQHARASHVNSVSTPASTNAPAHTQSRLIHAFLSTATPTWS